MHVAIFRFFFYFSA
ncbi:MULTISPECIES: pheST operon leader peptide PheM [Serratia]|nr:pheST operon leader peptide PheM [Serratia marcescens]ELH4207099.1 pheST operon leader peptide PheM [Serratia marcescens]MBH2544235.1 pheST operon leader peptide PheM [Serratia marcescens]MBH2568367.1 pheST operon leader peptide PheM [Serratia marcescens]MBH2592084.1 pheST operon leader peptide PheM [Serratia marcescens]MBH3289002.1 pheST operon leader peptide PheM [Serratia marcescens]